MELRPRTAHGPRIAPLDSSGVLAAFSALCVSALAAAAWAEGPVIVAPGHAHADAVVSTTCPTFHWTAAVAAESYELVVHHAVDRGETPEGGGPALRATVAGSALGWTPDLSRCLEPGRSYWWAVRALGVEGPGPWSAPHRFQTLEPPPLAELEEAMANWGEDQEAAAHSDRQRLPLQRASGPAAAEPHPTDGVAALAPVVDTPRSAPATLAPRAASPTLGAASLTFGNQLHLGGASDFFKGGALFSWSDGSGNLSLGHSALASNSSGFDNTAVGREALRNNAVGARNTAVGPLALLDFTASGNTAVGFEALRRNVNGSANTAMGNLALSHNVGSNNTALGHDAMGSSLLATQNTAVGRQALRASNLARNTAVGYQALLSNDLGTDNTAVGWKALAELAGSSNHRNVAVGTEALARLPGGSDNIAIGYRAGYTMQTSGANTIHIGSSMFSIASSDTIMIGRIFDPGMHTATYIQGIWGASTWSATAVMVNRNSILGTIASTASLKQDVHDLGEVARRARALRPMAFRYRELVAEDPDAAWSLGLIAEEVAELFPELVLPDGEGLPLTVKYHALPIVVLGALTEELRQIDELAGRLEALEGKRRWWQRWWSGR